MQLVKNLTQIDLETATKVVSLPAQGPLVRRLIALGLRPGVEVAVLRRAPLGDPMMVRVENTTLSIRQDVAEQVMVRG